jgi:hypothetical protein
MRFILLIFILLGASSPTFAGKAKCPEVGAILKGTKVQPYGHTYTEILEIHQTKKTSGYNGVWKVDKLTQIMTYPMVIKPPISSNGKVDMKKGLWMNCRSSTAGKVLTNICKDGNLTLDVVNNKIGYIKTNVWIGKIKGNEATLKFHEPNPMEPTITGTIQKISGGNLNLTIASPGEGEKLVYTQASPGVLELNIKANITPASKANDIVWDIPEITGSNRVVTPANMKGKNLTVKYTGLPQKNTSFGEYTISAKVDAGMCKADDHKEVKVYFPRDAKNNPGASEPNWFYYWSQTSAKVGPVKYGGLSGQCAQGGSGDKRDGLIGYYRYTIRDSKYYICDLGRLPGDFEFKMIRVKTLTPFVMDEPAPVTGIDTFAAASIHENEHYLHFKNWWFQFNPNPISSTGHHMMASYDSDGDFIPNTVEPTKGLNPNNKSTLSQYNSAVTLDDEELLCWIAESEWKIGDANKEDWAKPGKQW